jgi:nucleoside-diphosphate-sugar epimerase
MKKILITGASGFLGGALVRHALALGWEVWAGIRATSRRDDWADTPVRCIDLKYADPFALRGQLVEHVAQYGAWDYVIHCVGVTKAVHVSDFYTVNTLFANRLVDALMETKAVCGKYLFVSSLGAVGPADQSPLKMLSVEEKPHPDTAYGKSKLRAERYLETKVDFPWLVVRPAGIYGPRDKDFFELFRLLHKGIDVSVGLTPQQLDLIYVTDMATLCFQLLESAVCQKKYMVADGNHYSSTEFTQTILEEMGRKRSIALRIPLWVVWMVASVSGLLGRLLGTSFLVNPDKYRILRARHWTCDVTELRRAIDFDVKYPLRKGIRETVAWYTEKGWLN